MENLEVVVVLAEDSLFERTNAVTPLLSLGLDLGTSVALRPIVSSAERELPEMARASRSSPFSQALERYLVGQAPADVAEELARSMRGRPEVRAAYTKPLATNPLGPPMLEAIAAPQIADAVPNFRARQGYLEAAPGGVDAVHAWTLAGGRGAGVRIIDIEGGWQLSHVDLPANSGGLVGGMQYDDVEWRNHGTAVLAEIGGDDNPFGVTGIAPDAVLGAVSHKDIGSAKAIYLAAQKLAAGDVLLLEMHRPGPRYNYKYRVDQLGYICVEWWPDDLLAIQHAVARGIVVIEAAGNGAEDLDDPLYDAQGPGFPGGWRNPLRGLPASGAIVVGAGAPPSGAYGIDRSRLDFSNFGSRLDCQGWGRGVVTAGYGDLFYLAETPMLEDYWYTPAFSGTSSASPIVTGAVACLQGIAKKAGAPLPAARIVQALRDTGSPQQGNLGERIGARPDLRALVANIFGNH